MQKSYKILGVSLDLSKQVLYSLQVVYGVGKKTAKDILDTTGVPCSKLTRDLTEEEFSRIREEVESSGKYLVEGDLRQRIYKNIANMKAIRSYRGVRHKLGLPVNGQNTRGNARTRKGKAKMAVGGLNKPVSKK